MADIVSPELLSADTALHHSSWYRALTLAERLASLHASSAGTSAEAAGTSELVERRLQKWKAQPPFERDTFFADRLALEGATEAELRILLGEPIEAVQGRTPQPPVWLLTLTHAFVTFDSSETFGLAAAGQQKKLVEFLDPITPLLKQGAERLRAGIRELVKQYPVLPFDPEAIGALLFAHVLSRLLSVLVKPLTLELHIARLQERLQGETPEERFHAFVRHLCKPEEMLALLELYPVLARLLVTITDQGVAYGLELLSHLCADWSQIRERLTPEHDPGVVVEMQIGAGDTHRQGRSVALLTFRSGFKLLYKPKSLAIDAHFQTLLAWLNQRGDHPAFRAVQVLDKGEYGWCEYVQAQGCTEAAEIARFYERLGGYLALMYVLEATDLHYENVIASGEHPMLVDLETLFQPYFPVKSDDPKLKLPQGIVTLMASVLRPGLLPRHLWTNAEGDSVDISGLGGKGGQLTPRPIPILEEVGTDQMRLIRQRIPMQDQQNRPTLNGTAVDILEYLDQVSAGFTTIYHLLLTHREELLTHILPLFAHDQIRIVPRPTRSYAHLLQESVHPTLLRSALDRDRFFDHLWALVPGNPYLSRIIAAEVDDLREQNIPFFVTRPDTCALYTSRGERIDNYFDESGLAAVERRIQQLGEQDLARQIWIIQASFATKAMGGEHAARKSSHLLEAQSDASRERLLEAACAVGDRLCELAIRGSDEVSWLSLRLVGEREWNLSVTGPDLYSGAGGIGLFLAYLGAVTNETRYTSLAREVISAIHSQIEQIGDDILSPGAFNGWGGLLYLSAHLATLWQEPAFLTKAEGWIERFAHTIETDDKLDVMAGAAGGLRGLLTLYRVAPSARTLSAARRCGDHLLARVTPLPQGAAWQTALAKALPLTGYSHGAAGIALSLLELAALSGEERFQQSAIAAMEYERSQFSPEQQNWPDLRDLVTQGQQGDEQQFMTTWCHGAPGIGLARLASLQYIDDATIHEEIAIALKTTLAQGFGLNHSLCHGDLGNLEVLLTASQVPGYTQYRAEVARLTAMVLDSIDRQGWCTGVPLGTETPGLMLGIAGIGYELLRLAKPDRVPSVLLLAPPYSSPQW
jgi:type 2 lantibiotic biosynthesis protein LanM